MFCRLGVYAGWKLSEAKKETIMNKLTLLTALLLDKHDITAIEMNPATIVDAFNREAAHAMRLKKLEL